MRKIMKFEKQKVEMIKSVTLDRDEVLNILDAYNLIRRFSYNSMNASDLHESKKIAQKLQEMFDFCNLNHDYCGDAVLPDHTDTNTAKKYIHEYDKEEFDKKWKSSALV